MRTSKEITEELLNRIKFQIKQQGVELSYVEFKQLTARQVGSITRPSANISVESAKYSRLTMNTVRNATLMIAVFLIVYNVQSEEARRQKALELIQDIADVLSDEKLGLPLQHPIEPKTLSNVTDADYNSKGYFIYQLNISCSFNFEKKKFDDDGLFERITNNFYLNSPNDDGAADQQSVVDLVVAYGGTPLTRRFVDPIFGGLPGTEFDIQTVKPIYGGRPGSTY